MRAQTKADRNRFSVIRHIKTQGYHVPLEYSRNVELFRLTVAWCAGLAGAFMFAVGALYLGLR